MTRAITIGSLFSGIGGLELGLECALRDGGFSVETTWQCEADSWCRGILARHWPAAVRYNDVRGVGIDAARVDIICGGFPCQDVSYAGRGAGLSGERSGLWFEFARVVRELRPRVVVVENVAALASRGLDAVLGSLSEAGYDAVWFDVRASDVGAPHRRERIFIVAWQHMGDAASARSERRTGGSRTVARRVPSVSIGAGEVVADTGCVNGDGRAYGDAGRELDGDASRRDEGAGDDQRGRGDGGEAVADAIGEPAQRRGRSRAVARAGGGAQGEAQQRQRGEDAARGGGEALAGVGLADPCGEGLQGHGHVARGVHSQHTGPRGVRGRIAEPVVGGEADGLPGRVGGPASAEAMGAPHHDLAAHRWPVGPDEAQPEGEPPRVTKDRSQRRERLKALGNAVVPQVAYVVGCVVARVLHEVAP